MNKHPKILFFSQRFPPSVGGTPTVMKKVCDALNPTCIKVISMAEYGEDTPLPVTPYEHFRLPAPPKWRRRFDKGQVFKSWSYAEQAGKLLDNWAPDAVIAVFPGACFLTSGFLYAKKHRVPFFPFFMDTWEDCRKGKERLIAHFFEPRILACSSGFFCPNPAITGFLQEKYPDVPGTLIPHIAEPIPDLNEVPCEFDGHDGLLIVYSGQLYSTTADPVVNVIHALPKLQDLNPLLVLTTPDPPHRLDGLGISASKQVKIVNYPNRLSVLKLQHEADILLNTVAFKNCAHLQVKTLFATKTIEYMQTGKPMLLHGPSGTAFVDYATEKGFAEIVDTPDIDRLAQAIRRIYTEPESETTRLARKKEIDSREPQNVVQMLVKTLCSEITTSLA